MFLLWLRVILLWTDYYKHIFK